MGFIGFSSRAQIFRETSCVRSANSFAHDKSTIGVALLSACVVMVFVFGEQKGDPRVAFKPEVNIEAATCRGST